ncbi:MAG: DUF4342 domain-containing protein [Armatimonadota bacterium]|nr:DUF4342 domain-containing protein [Armatimonadota bacterium]
MNEMEATSAQNLVTEEEPISKVASRAADALDLVIDLLEDIQKVVSSGRPKKLRIRFGDKLLAEIPVALTAAMAIAAGLAAVVLTKLAVEVEHET